MMMVKETKRLYVIRSFIGCGYNRNDWRGCDSAINWDYGHETGNRKPIKHISQSYSAQTVGLKRDMLQVAPRKILDEFSMQQPVAHNQGEYLVELTHSESRHARLYRSADLQFAACCLCG